jgi:GMP reductase|tara:strand:+ start:2340 stop:3371 length:1032 start_codon:yes stop_codon:yes gene_type:complete
MNIINDIKLDYSDVLIRPKRSILSSRKEVSLERTFTFKNGKVWSGVPIVAANMDTIGTVEVAKVLSKNNMLTCLCKHISNVDATDEEIKNMALSFGMKEKSYDVLFNTDNDFNYTLGHDFFCLDVANGYSQAFVDFVKEVHEAWPEKIIIAGNVVTAEMTEALLLAGADIIKIGIGPGSVCTTRKVAGVGYPQLSAVTECADAAHGLGGFIMADGGCQSPGDVAKAFGGGADFVMLGGMLAGHEECAGECVTDDSGASYKVFYGMSSATAMDKHSGGVATYRASEGKTVKVPYKGDVQDTINEILGGVRSACTYTGARNIKQLPKCTTFVQVNRQLNTVFGDS